MKIAIDTFGCDHGESGIGAYILNFVTNIPDEYKDNFELFGPEMDRYKYNINQNIKYNAVTVDDNLKSEKRWHKYKLNSFCKKNKYDIVLFPSVHKVMPGKINAKSVFIFNGIFSSLGDKSKLKKIKKCLKNSDLIITASNFIKNDLLEYVSSFNKIIAINNGIDHKVFFPLPDIDSEIVDIKPFAIKRPYFLYTSRLSGSDKKHIELIKAFEIFKQRTNCPHRLVLAGSDDYYAKNIHDYAYNSEYASDIFITGYFPQESLQKLYCSSEACIFPSVNEGAGLPVTEAMACGVPVLCSNKGAFNEIAKDAPLYFDSDNPEEIALDMQKVVEDKDLYKQMVQKGLENSRHISWENTVKQTIQAVLSL